MPASCPPAACPCACGPQGRGEAGWHTKLRALRCRAGLASSTANPPEPAGCAPRGDPAPLSVPCPRRPAPTYQMSLLFNPSSFAFLSCPAPAQLACLPRPPSLPTHPPTTPHHPHPPSLTPPPLRTQPQELANDPLGILRPASKLQHQLPLASAYAAVAAAPDADHGMQRQKRRLDPGTGEPR